MREPCVECPESRARVTAVDLSHADTARNGRCELGGCEIADDKDRFSFAEERIGARSMRVLRQKGDEDAGVKVDAQTSASSRIALTSVPASVLAFLRPTLRAAR